MNWPKIHHPDPIYQKKYEEACQIKYFDRNIGVDRDFPKIEILENGFYVIYETEEEPKQSAWNSYKIVENTNPKSGWVSPKKTKPDVILEGNYIGYCSWFQGNYSHMLTDNLPYISWLKSEFKNYNFLMLDHPVSREIFYSFDINFYKKIFWIKKDQVIFVRGNLLITIPDMHPCIMSSKLIDYFMKWTSEKLPTEEQENVIYYNRSLDTSTRIINKENNKEIICLIKKDMIRKNIKGKLIIFNSARENFRMPIYNQIKLFRKAHTVIGPHGSGLCNILWSQIIGKNPIKFLEFIPGLKGYSAHVQHEFNGYHNVLSGLPIDYHCLLYEPISTNQETFICLSHLKMALDYIWPFKKEPLFL